MQAQMQPLNASQKWAVVRSLAVVVPVACVMGGIEAGLVFALRIGVRRDVHWPVTLMAVLAALFLALGVLRHYWDIYRHRTVRGISFLFVGLDAMGDLTSLLSLLFEPRVDVLGLVIYATELTLWIGVFACGGYYNFMPWLKEKLQKRRSQESNAHEARSPPHNPIAMHDMPSSTSVFRTSSEGPRLRR